MNTRRKSTAGHSLAKFSLGLTVVVLGLVVSLWVLVQPTGVEEREWKVEKGESTLAIGRRLAAENLIRSPQAFRLVVKALGLAGKLQAGSYVLSGQMSTIEIAQALQVGTDEQVKLTIPEGYRIEQIAEVAGFSINEFRVAAQQFEGQLFPDTYFVKKDISPEELVELMNKNLGKKVGQTNTRTLIMASLIERETKHDEEKPIVAGILEKRLTAGWPLELDATIQYWLGKPGDWWPNTTIADRKIKSAYNTYLKTGLPPNPICNPGLAAILAAQNPVESPYWFYLHEPDGTIHYAVTSAEHNQNIDKYLR